MSGASSTDRKTGRLGNNSTPSAPAYDVETDFQEMKLPYMPRRLHKASLYGVNRNLFQRRLPLRQCKSQSSPVLPQIDFSESRELMMLREPGSAVRKVWFCVWICSG